MCPATMHILELDASSHPNCGGIDEKKEHNAKNKGLISTQLYEERYTDDGDAAICACVRDIGAGEFKVR